MPQLRLFGNRRHTPFDRNAAFFKKHALLLYVEVKSNTETAGSDSRQYTGNQ